MFTNINQSMFIAIQNYFYIHNKELFKPQFVTPTVRKIHKIAKVEYAIQEKSLKSKISSRVRNLSAAGVHRARKSNAKNQDFASRKHLPSISHLVSRIQN